MDTYHPLTACGCADIRLAFNFPPSNEALAACLRGTMTWPSCFALYRLCGRGAHRHYRLFKLHFPVGCLWDVSLVIPSGMGH